MNTVWILSVCLGVLWGGMCEVTRRFEYPTQASCEFEEKRANARLRDGYAKCAPEEKVKETKDVRNAGTK